MIRVLDREDYKITQKFGGTNINGNPHLGIDIVTSDRTACNILAHSRGTVVKIVKDYQTQDKTGGSYGNYVKIKHPTGAFTMYSHLEYGSVHVNVGDEVNKGQVLGRMGCTGLATDVHLHFEVRDMYETKVDPEIYLENPLPDLPDEESSPAPSDSGNTPDSGAEVYNIGDKVLVLSGVATEDSYGGGSHTAEYTGNINDSGDIKYITDITDLNRPRPYHLSNDKENTKPKGWVSAEQIKKI